MLASAIKLACTLILASSPFLCFSQEAGIPISAPILDFPPAVKSLIENSCADCHLGGNQEGGVRLDELGQLPVNEKLHLLNQIHHHTE